MRQNLSGDESGFTLAEVLVTMLMMMTVMFALYSIFDMSLRVFSFGNNKTEAVQNARQGMERMEREIRAAYPYDRDGGDETLFSGYGSDSITFGNDRNGDRQITAPDEEITYRLSAGAPYTLLRVNPSDDLIPDPAVESVGENGLQFEYLDRFGDAVSIEPDIEMVRITLDIKVDEQLRDEATQTLTTEVTLRNRLDREE